MQMIKFLSLIMVFAASSYAGIVIGKKYQNRVKELKEMKTLLSIFLTKIKLTYEPIPEIFGEIGNLRDTNIHNIFKLAAKNMKEMPAGKAWENAIKAQNTNLKKDDLEVLNGLSNLLGKVDIEGQIKEIELVNSFLDTQINEAEQECIKSTKLYKKLGIVVGLTIVIILI